MWCKRNYICTAWSAHMHVSKRLSTFRCPHFAFMCVCAPCPSSYEVHCETESATNPVVEAAQVQQAVNPYLNPLFSSGSDQQLWTQIHSSLDPVICPLHVFVKAPAISNPIGVNTPPRQRSLGVFYHPTGISNFKRKSDQGSSCKSELQDTTSIT